MRPFEPFLILCYMTLQPSLVHPSVHQSVIPSVRPSVGPSIWSIRWSINPSVCQSIILLDRLSPNPSVRPSVRPSIGLFVHLSTGPSVRPSIIPLLYNKNTPPSPVLSLHTATFCPRQSSLHRLTSLVFGCSTTTWATIQTRSSQGKTGFKTCHDQRSGSFIKPRASNSIRNHCNMKGSVTNIPTDRWTIKPMVRRTNV